jgi:hypothetical protein
MALTTKKTTVDSRMSRETIPLGKWQGGVEYQLKENWTGLIHFDSCDDVVVVDPDLEKMVDLRRLSLSTSMSSCCLSYGSPPR